VPVPVPVPVDRVAAIPEVVVADGGAAYLVNAIDVLDCRVIYAQCASDGMPPCPLVLRKGRAALPLVARRVAAVPTAIHEVVA
jgi:hypothetical protein